MALPKQIQQREYTKFIEDVNGKVAVRTYDTALIALNKNYTQKIEYDASGNAIYIGYADPGTATSATSWQIRKMTYDSNNNLTDVQWAGGDTEFDNIWDSRASLSYS